MFCFPNFFLSLKLHWYRIIIVFSSKQLIPFGSVCIDKSMLNIEKNCKVKVLVLGDSGVGKSSFTNLLCHNQSGKNPGYTIGCSVEIKLHDYKQGTADERTYCVEVWDIGASKSHISSRFIFYNNVNGIILVHDLTNFKSLQNLSKWLNDVLNSESTGGLASIRIGTTGNSSNSEELTIPILLVGTKFDLVPESKRSNVINRSKCFASDIGCQDIHLDNIESKYIAAGSGNAVQLSKFFDKAIEHTLALRTTTKHLQSPVNDIKAGATERRRHGSVGRILGFKSD